MENCAVQLRKRSSTRDVYESSWPVYEPVFINPNYIIHKPKRTKEETVLFAELARSGSFSLDGLLHKCDTFETKNSNDDMNITIEENIVSIFLSNNSNKRPQIILIEGAPGVGKTMLMEEIKYLWATEKILQDKKMLLLLSLHDLEIDQIEHIKDLFYCSIENKEDAENCAKYFESNDGNGLVILLDGLDEIRKPLKVVAFLKDIRKKFVDACIVITSRPHETLELQRLVSCRVQIIGFTDNNKRQKFVEDNLQESAAEHLINYLKKHEIIDTLCYIPFNMSILASKCRDIKKEEDLSESQTELTKEIVRFTVFRNLEKRGITITRKDLKHLPKPYDEIFHNISELAYKSSISNKWTFTSAEITKVCSVPSNGDEAKEWAIGNGLGLIQTTKYFIGVDGDTETLSNFTHYAVQELLAAWYIAFHHRSCFKKLPLTCSIQAGMQKCIQFSFQQEVLETSFWKGDFINMWFFYIGLTGGEDFAFKCFLSEESFLYSCMQFRRGYSHHNTTSSEHVNAAQCIISKNILKNKIKMVLLYFMLQEAPNNEMVKHLNVVVSESRLDVSEQTLDLKDLCLLGLILSRPYLTIRWELVDISNCEIDDEKFQVLHEKLIRNDGRPKPEIKTLSLSGNKLKLSSDMIVELVCIQKIVHLNLSSNFLANVVPFKQCGDFLETLCISNNNLGNENALELFNVLKYLRKLKVLKLSHNNINDDQHVIDAIGLALCYCNSLEELELDGNTTEFEDKAMLLFQVINKIKSSITNVHYYRLTDKAHAFLKILGYCDQIDYQVDSCVLKNKIMQSEVVNVSCNHLKTDDGCNLGQHLRLLVNLKILNITENDISHEATESLTTGMLLTPNLKEFKYDENLQSFNEESTMIFKMIHQLRTTCINIFTCPPSKLKALVFILQRIDTINVRESSDIVSTISHITVLNLSHTELTTQDYKLTSEDLMGLCAVLRWFKQLKVLDVRNNDITDEVTESISKAMLQIYTFTSLKLAGNPIYDNQRSMAIFDTIRMIRS